MKHYFTSIIWNAIILVIFIYTSVNYPLVHTTILVILMLLTSLPIIILLVPISRMYESLQSRKTTLCTNPNAITLEVVIDIVYIAVLLDCGHPNAAIFYTLHVFAYLITYYRLLNYKTPRRS